MEAPVAMIAPVAESHRDNYRINYKLYKYLYIYASLIRFNSNLYIIVLY